MDFREAYDRIVQDKCKFMCSMPEDQPCPDACIWRTMLYALKKQIRLEPKTDRLRIGVGRCKCGVEFLDTNTAYCGNCGQRLDWRGNEDER